MRLAATAPSEPSTKRRTAVRRDTPLASAFESSSNSLPINRLVSLSSPGGGTLPGLNRAGGAHDEDPRVDQFGPIKRLDLIQSTLHMFEQQGVARILAEPNLLVLEGEEGSILIGGEIPIPVVQSGVGGATGGAVQVLTKGAQVKIPSETLLEFRLQQPVSVTPSQS